MRNYVLLLSLKIITAILSIVLLVLSCMPCNDKFGSVKNTAKGDLVSVIDNNQAPHEVDDCSPLCTCACCATFVVNNQFQRILMVDKQFMGIVFPILIDDRIKEMQYGIWQPPQLLA